MDLSSRINAFSILGDFLRQFKDDNKDASLAELNKDYYDLFKTEIAKSEINIRSVDTITNKLINVIQSIFHVSSVTIKAEVIISEIILKNSPPNEITR